MDFVIPAEKLYTATLVRGESKVLGESGGAESIFAGPFYRFEGIKKAERQDIEAVLSEAYFQGIYGHGSIGEVRDMLYAMATAGEKFKMKLEIPEETDKKAKEEASEEEPLPLGYMF